jgi:sugar/nucleoside kinase (ribokinase family)
MTINRLPKTSERVFDNVDKKPLLSMKKAHDASTEIENSYVIVLSSLKEESEAMDLLTIGGITFDYLFWVDRLPEKHFEGVIKRHGKFFGGRAPNVAVAAARLGIRTGLVSSVGEDFKSEGYEDHLRAIGVDLRGVIKAPKKKTKQIFIFTDPHGNQITFFDYGAERYFRKMDVPCDLIKESKNVHISSSGDYNFNVRCAEFAYNSGIMVSFDPGNDPFTEITEYLEAMLRNCNLLFMNDLEACSMVKRLDLNGTIELLDFGPRIIVVINKNDKASTIYTQNSTEHIPSTVRIVKDPTGASDGYVSGFIAGILKGYDVRTAGMLGSVEASFVVEEFGAQTNLPDWRSLCKRCQEQFKDLVSIS